MKSKHEFYLTARGMLIHAVDVSQIYEKAKRISPSTFYRRRKKNILKTGRLELINF
jgi:hypothetical protein